MKCCLTHCWIKWKWMSQYSIQEGNTTWCLQFFMTNCDNKWNGSVRKKSILNRRFCSQSVSWILPQDIYRVKAHYNGTFWARKCTHFLVHFVLFWGNFFSFHLAFWETLKMDFLTQRFSHNSCYLSNDSVFSKNLCIHTRTLVWMKNFI
jgi:hypothetical protein